MSRRTNISRSLHLFSAMSLRAIAPVVFVVCAGTSILQAQSDTQPPQLLSLSISPATVDVTASDQVVTLTMRVTDNLSGVAPGGASLAFINPSNGSGFVGGSSQNTTVILDGILQISVTVPRYSGPGAWGLDFLSLRDNVGNSIFLTKDTLSAAGFPTTIQVVDANPDTTPPQFQTFNFSSSSVDVSSGPQTITLDLRVTDNLSGILGGSLYFCAMSPSGKQARCGDNVELVGTI